MSESRDAELQRLAAENAALNEQVKLLVKMEQRLSRAHRENDRQLENIRALADYSLWCSAERSSAQILERTRTLVKASFSVDFILAGLVDEAGVSFEPLESDRFRGRLPLDLLPTQLETAVHDPSELSRLCDVLDIRPRTGIAVIPLRADGGRVAAVVIATRLSTVSSFYRAALDGAALPFLQLIATHGARALESSMLTTSLREQSRRLAEANSRLSQSLEQLAQSQKMEAIGRLAGGIAHDFNNLLTVIVSHAELLGETVPKRGPAREDLEQIISASRHAAEITKQLLTFGRSEPMESDSLDLNEVVRTMSRMLRPMLGERFTLDLDLDPTLPWLRIDSSQIRQVLLNLVINARDAMRDGGGITVRTRLASSAEAEAAGARRSEQNVLMTIEDEGTGMDAETCAKIFDPFFTTKPVGQGTGLGLSTVYGIVKNAGGVIELASEVGRGTRFDVFLPCQEHVTAKRPSARRGTVLVVEDEDAIRQVVCRILRSHGYKVVDSRSAEEAIAVVDRHPSVDLLVTDVVMPGIGGVELAARLRESLSELRVLYLSGYTFDQLDTRQLVEGDERFLAKPFTPRELLVEVERTRQRDISTS